MAGIRILIHFKDHPPSHFHAEQGDEKIVVDIETLKVTEGRASSKMQRTVLEWAQRHQDELRANWELRAEKKQTFPIDPD